VGFCGQWFFVSARVLAGRCHQFHHINLDERLYVCSAMLVPIWQLALPRDLGNLRAPAHIDKVR
jgi:hypothetical protein